MVSEAFLKALAVLPEIDAKNHKVVFPPVKIVGDDSGVSRYLLVIGPVRDCLDEAKSVFTKYLPDDPIRPDIAGDYKLIPSLIIDRGQAEGSHIFRLQGRTKAIIVSEDVKDRLEAAGLQGMRFGDVSGSTATPG